MRRGALLGPAALLVGALLSPVAANAEPEAIDLQPPARAAPLEWRWQRFRAWEYPVTAAARGAAAYLRAAGPQPSVSWTGGILGDDWVEDHTAIQNIAKRRVVVTLTDVFFYGSMAYRLVDSAVLPSLVWRSPDVAFQMSLIDLESFGFVAITLWGQQALLGRERPYAKRCSDPAFAASEGGCAPDSAEHGRSFFAGHPAVVLAAAGLTCTHHAHLALYGGGAADDLACGLMIGAAAATGVGRMVTEEHHLSDVIVGYGLGAFAGWALPELLHYGHPRPSTVAARTTETAVRVTLAPVIGESDLGLGVRGAF